MQQLFAEMLYTVQHADSGTSVAEVCRKVGNLAFFYQTPSAWSSNGDGLAWEAVWNRLLVQDGTCRSDESMTGHDYFVASFDVHRYERRMDCGSA